MFASAVLGAANTDCRRQRETRTKFTEVGITDMKSFSNEELATIMSALQKALDYVHEKETLTEQVADLLDLLIPGDGHRLSALGDWDRTPALESEIIEWLTGGLEEKEGNRAKRGKLLSDEGDMLWVQAEHMLGDHWWVAVSSVRFHEAEGDFDEYGKSSPGRKSAAAIVRIVGSAGLLL